MSELKGNIKTVIDVNYSDVDNLINKYYFEGKNTFCNILCLMMVKLI